MINEYILGLIARGIINIQRHSFMEDEDVVFNCPCCTSEIIVTEEYLIANQRCPACGRFV